MRHIYDFHITWPGVLHLLLLLVPNLLWLCHRPEGPDTVRESRILQNFERIGQVLVVTGLLCWPFPSPALRPWSLWLAASLLLMALYEVWWIQYFRGPATHAAMHSPLWGIPMAGATLPSAALLLLSVYGRSITFLLAAVVFAVGHVGIHWQHHRASRREREENNRL